MVAGVTRQTVLIPINSYVGGLEEVEKSLPGVGRPLKCVEGCSRLASIGQEFCMIPAV